MRHLCFAVTIALMLSCTVAQDSQSSKKPPNAADIYLEAFKKTEAMSNQIFDALNEEGDDGFRPLSKTQIELVEATTEIAKLLTQARAIERCEWDEPFFKNPISNELPSWLAQTRTISRLACMRARYQREIKTNAREGIDEVMRAWSMGRRISHGSTLINGLVQISIDAMFIENLAASLPSLKPDEIDYILRSMKELPKADTLRNASEREIKAVVAWFRNELPKDIEKNVGLWEKMSRTQHGMLKLLNDDKSDFDPLPYRAVGNIARNDIKRYQQMVDEFEKTYQEQLKIFEVPLDELEATHDNWKKRLNKNNLLIKTLTDDVLGIHKNLPRTEHLITVKHAMFQAGINYIKGDEEALAKHKEPVTGERFILVKDDTGFFIRSSQYTDAESYRWSLRFGKLPK